MDTIQARKLANENLRVWGLTERGWTFDFDSAKSRFGLCSPKRKKIFLSFELTKLNDIADVLDTILHEIAHALVREFVGRKHGHDNIWKAYCLLVGARPYSCYNSDDIAQPAPKFIGKCAQGHTFTRFRKPEGTHSCSICHKGYDERYLITWTPYGKNN